MFYANLEKSAFCFNVESSNEILQRKFELFEGHSPKKTRVGCGQALFRHNVIVENFPKIGPVLQGRYPE